MQVSCSAAVAIADGSATAAAIDGILVPHVPPPLPPRVSDLKAALAEEQGSQGSYASAPGVDANLLRLTAEHAPVFSTIGLQMWLLLACQEPSGLRDKPGKNPDFYHTCYCLSGLAVAQQCSGQVLGQANNSVRATDVCLNVIPEQLEVARRHFLKPPC